MNEHENVSVSESEHRIEIEELVSEIPELEDLLSDDLVAGKIGIGKYQLHTHDSPHIDSIASQMRQLNYSQNSKDDDKKSKTFVIYEQGGKSHEIWESAKAVSEEFLKGNDFDLHEFKYAAIELVEGSGVTERWRHHDEPHTKLVFFLTTNVGGKYVMRGDVGKGVLDVKKGHVVIQDGLVKSKWSQHRKDRYALVVTYLQTAPSEQEE